MKLWIKKDIKKGLLCFITQIILFIESFHQWLLDRILNKWKHKFIFKSKSMETSNKSFSKRQEISKIEYRLCRLRLHQISQLLRFIYGINTCPNKVQYFWTLTFLIRIIATFKNDLSLEKLFKSYRVCLSMAYFKWNGRHWN